MESQESDWTSQDPGDLLVSESSSSSSDDEAAESPKVPPAVPLIPGRTVRKPTTPGPIPSGPKTTPKKVVQPQVHEAPPSVKQTLQRCLEPVALGARQEVPSKKMKCHVGTQTIDNEPALTCRHTLTKTSRFEEDGRQVELVEFREWVTPIDRD